MKYGVLTFSYNNVKNFQQSVADHGFFSMNLGDYMQTLAIRRLYHEFGIPDTQTIDIDRDSMASYSGEPVVMLMNGVFFPWSFPLPANIIPVFVGFQAGERVVKENLAFFKSHEPIGCRDTDTADLFKKYGIEAFTTGCLTLTFEQREPAPENGKPFIIYGGGAGAFPAEALRHMPEDLLRSAEIIYQRKIVHRYPLDAKDMKDAERYAAYLLREYRERASIVITPLHHAATPCLSSGIPVILCRKEHNTRFSFLRKLMDVYTPERFEEIDWSAPLADISHARGQLIEKAKSMLNLAVKRL